jgi:hypothetical protein
MSAPFPPFLVPFASFSGEEEEEGAREDIVLELLNEDGEKGENVCKYRRCSAQNELNAAANFGEPEVFFSAVRLSAEGPKSALFEGEKYPLFSMGNAEHLTRCLGRFRALEIQSVGSPQEDEDDQKEEQEETDEDQKGQETLQGENFAPDAADPGDFGGRVAPLEEEAEEEVFLVFERDEVCSLAAILGPDVAVSSSAAAATVCPECFLGAGDGFRLPVRVAALVFRDVLRGLESLREIKEEPHVDMRGADRSELVSPSHGETADASRSIVASSGDVVEGELDGPSHDDTADSTTRADNDGGSEERGGFVRHGCICPSHVRFSKSGRVVLSSPLELSGVHASPDSDLLAVAKLVLAVVDESHDNGDLSTATAGVLADVGARILSSECSIDDALQALEDVPVEDGESVLEFVRGRLQALTCRCPHQSLRFPAPVLNYRPRRHDPPQDQLRPRLTVAKYAELESESCFVVPLRSQSSREYFAPVEKTVIIIGTVHVAEASAALVQRVIRATTPSSVLIELCRVRSEMATPHTTKRSTRRSSSGSRSRRHAVLTADAPTISDQSNAEPPPPTADAPTISDQASPVGTPLQTADASTVSAQASQVPAETSRVGLPKAKPRKSKSSSGEGKQVSQEKDEIFGAIAGSM